MSCLRQSVGACVCRPGKLAAFEFVPECGRSQQDGAVLSAQGVRLRVLLSGPARGLRNTAEAIPGIRLLLLLLRKLAATLSPIRRNGRFALRVGAQFHGRRNREQRRLPAAVFPPGGGPGSRDRASAKRRQGG